jgi:hypothetical protein
VTGHVVPKDLDVGRIDGGDQRRQRHPQRLEQVDLAPEPPHVHRVRLPAGDVDHEDRGEVGHDARQSYVGFAALSYAEPLTAV